MLSRLLLYGCFGWCAEIAWTALSDALNALRRGGPVDRGLTGYTYLWMLPIYGGGGLLFEFVHGLVRTAPWAARGLVYMLGCFAVEYAAGWAIQRLTGEIPWDYSTHTLHIHGLIRLDYAPVWFGFGLLLEHVEVFVRAAGPLLPV